MHGDTYSGDVTKLSRQEAERAGGADMVVSVDKVFPVEEVLQALDFVRRGENLGKVVMSVSNTATALDWFAKQLDGIKF